MALTALPFKKTTLQDVVKQIPHVLTLPKILERIVSTINNPQSTPADLHLIIARDPALAARILKVANSAFYGRPGQVGSIDRAIVLLGLTAVRNVAVGASLFRVFHTGGEVCPGIASKDLWTHSVSVALTAQQLAREIGLPLADDAFLCGLIHDVGLLALHQRFPEMLGAACRLKIDTGRDFREIEHELIGFDHQQLGKSLTEHWRFPLPCQLVAGHHHDPASAATEGRVLVALVHAADTICCRSRDYGFHLTAVGQPLNEKAMSIAALPSSAISRVSGRLSQILQQSASLFD